MIYQEQGVGGNEGVEGIDDGVGGNEEIGEGVKGIGVRGNEGVGIFTSGSKEPWFFSSSNYKALIVIHSNCVENIQNFEQH